MSALLEKEAAGARLADAEKELADQPRDRRALIQALTAAVMAQAIEESRERESFGELEHWAALSAAFAALVRRISGDELSKVLEALDSAVAETDDAESLEDWGRLRVLALHERARGDCYTVAWLEEHGISRQRLNQWRNAGRLYGIRGLPGVRGFAYPRWQFSDQLQPRPFMATIVAAAEDARLAPLGLHLFMTNPEVGNGRTPLELLEEGELELVERLVRAANAQGQ